MFLRNCRPGAVLFTLVTIALIICGLTDSLDLAASSPRSVQNKKTPNKPADKPQKPDKQQQTVDAQQTDETADEEQETTQPTLKQLEDFRTLFEKLNKAATDNLDKYDKAVKFVASFDADEKAVPSKKLAERLTSTFERVGNAKTSYKSFSDVIAAAAEINPMLADLAKQWKVMEQFAENDFTEIKALKDPKQIAALTGYKSFLKDEKPKAISEMFAGAPNKQKTLVSAAGQSHDALVKAIGDAVDAIKPLVDLKEGASGDALRSALKKGLPPLASGLAAAGSAKEALSKFEGTYKEIPGIKIEGEIDPKSLYERIQAASSKGHLVKLLSTLTNDLLRDDELGQQTLDRAITDPFKERIQASAIIRSLNVTVDDTRPISAAALSVLEALKSSSLPDTIALRGTELQSIDDQVRSIGLSLERLAVVAQLLLQPNPVNVEQWTGEYVNLYYFDDVPRLMNALLSIDPEHENAKDGRGAKKVGGDDTLRQAYQAKRDDLVKDIEALAQKRQELNNKRATYEKRRIQLRESLAEKEKKLAEATREADREDAAYRRADDDYRRLELRDDLDKKERDRIAREQEAARNERDTADKDMKEAQAAYEADRTNKDKEAAFLRARARDQRANRDYDALERRHDDYDRRIIVNTRALEKANADLQEAKSKHEAADSKKKTAESELDAAKTALDEGGGELKKLEGEIDNATDAVSKSMTDAYVAALAENTAFANMRDNQPFYQSRPHYVVSPDVKSAPDFLSTDPVQRVFLFGFPDSKTIFIRGRASDVQQVRELIASFDRPQAQALMTLWSLELSSQSTPDGAKAVSRYIRHIEDELRISRAQTDGSLSLMRQVINEVVDEAQGSPFLATYGGRYFSPGLHAAFKFYDEKVFEELDLIPNGSLTGSNDLIEALVPDPRGTTTLAEALVVLSLAREPYRARIVSRFSERIQFYLQNTTRDSLGQDVKICHTHQWTVSCPNCAADSARPYQPPTCPTHKPRPDICSECHSTAEQITRRMPQILSFGSLIRYIGPLGDGAWLRSVRNEVITQLRSSGGREIRNAARRVMDKLARYTLQLDQLEQKIFQAEQECPPGAAPPPGPGDTPPPNTPLGTRNRLRHERDQVLSEGEPVLVWAHIRPTAAELRSLYDGNNTAFFNALKLIHDACVVRNNIQASNETVEKIEKRLAELTSEYNKLNNERENAVDRLSTQLTNVFSQQAVSPEAVRALGVTISGSIASNYSQVKRGVAEKLSSPEKLEEFDKILKSLDSQPAKSSAAMMPGGQGQLPRMPTLKASGKAVTTAAGSAAESRSAVRSTRRNLDTLDEKIKRKKEELDAAKDKQAKLSADALKADEAANKSREARNTNSASIAATVAATQEFRTTSQLAFDNAREAAANETIKRALKAIDEDMHHMFIDPMLDRIREQMSGEGVSVGVLQRTQVIASNRLVAKVDPIASSTLNLAGTDFDVLKEMLQLSQFVGQVQAGPLMPALAGLQKNKEKETPPSYYGITSGNTFRVTPILDPTGQALRFRFDHVLRTAVREPNGSVSQQLNRIEQMGVNTEVQLSNHEIGLISRFQSNQKLGQPTLKSGGIPILKHIPILNEIPLIGWFERRDFRAPVVQQSLLLGQTAIFPTIGDVVHLLTKPMPDMPYPNGASDK